MASIFKRKRKKTLKNGKKVTVKSENWYVRLIDVNDKQHTIRLFKDKTASQQRAAELQKEFELEKSGVVDKYKKFRKMSLSEHLQDFHKALLAKGNKTDYSE